MKNKSKWVHYFYLLMLSGALLTSCAKESAIVDPNLANGNTIVNIESIADNILTDSLFVNLVRDFDSEGKKLQSLKLDSQLVIHSNTLLMKSILTFFTNQKDYKNLNSVDKLKAGCLQQLGNLHLLFLTSTILFNLCSAQYNPIFSFI